MPVIDDQAASARTLQSGAFHRLSAKLNSSLLLHRGFVFLYGVGIALLYRPLSQRETGDAAIWDYVAQCILRGQVLYRDVIEIKGPGSAYLSALAMLLA